MTKELELFKDNSIPIETLLGSFISILGVRGSGKTNTSAVIIEELLKYNVSITVFDIDGEYWGLQEKYQILLVGDTERANVPLSLEYAKEIARIVIKNKIPVILDLSTLLKEQRNEFLYDYLTEIWKLEHEHRVPHFLFIEEAHEFVPQGVNSDLKEVIIRAALRGRKWGIGAALISQRSAKVDKDALTQAEIQILHRVVHPADFRVYQDLLAMTRGEIKEKVPGLDDGEVFFKIKDNIQRLHIRQRETFHPGFTPGLDKEVKSPPLKKISQELVERFKKVTQQKKKKKDALEKLRERLKQKDAELTEYQKRINDLEQQLEIASRFTVDVKLPTQQTIHKAVIKQLRTLGVVTEKGLPKETKSQNHIELESVDKTFSVSYTDIETSYKRHLDRIKSRVEDATPLEFRIVEFLEDRKPSKYSTQQLAAWVGVEYSTLRSNPPKTMLDLSLIKRERGERGMYFYKSNLKPFLDDQFELYRPEIGEEELQAIYDEFRDFLREKGDYS